MAFYKNPHPSKTFNIKLIKKFKFVLSFDRSKERTKEKSPAGDKLPEILSQLRQKFNSPSARTEIFAYRNCSEFLNGNFSQAGLF